MNSPQELQLELISLFPELEAEYVEDEPEEFVYIPPLTFHRVWMTFCDMAPGCLLNVDKKTLIKLCEIINLMVGSAGNKENAVSTCFLEHASQVGVKKIIKPYLSQEAKKELR